MLSPTSLFPETQALWWAISSLPLLPAPEKPWSLLQGGISIPFPSRTSFHQYWSLFWLISLHQQSVFCTWIKQSSPLSFLLFLGTHGLAILESFLSSSLLFSSLSVQTCFILVFLTSLPWLPWHGSWMTSNPHIVTGFSYSALKTLVFSLLSFNIVPPGIYPRLSHLELLCIFLNHFRFLSFNQHFYVSESSRKGTHLMIHLQPPCLRSPTQKVIIQATIDG